MAERNSDSETPSPFLRVYPDCAEELRSVDGKSRSKDFMYRAAEKGDIPAIRIGRLWFVPRAAWEEFKATGINPLRQTQTTAG